MIRSLIFGTGVGIALGAAGASLLHRNQRVRSATNGDHGRRLRILILGGGFAGYYALRSTSAEIPGSKSR